MKSLMEKLEHLMELGGTKKDITLLAISGVAVLLSLFGGRPFPFDMAWIAVILCGLPIILEAVIGLVTAFDIKADVLVSLALIASVAIGEDFAAGEDSGFAVKWKTWKFTETWLNSYRSRLFTSPHSFFIFFPSSSWTSSRYLAFR